MYRLSASAQPEYLLRGIVDILRIVQARVCVCRQKEKTLLKTKKEKEKTIFFIPFHAMLFFICDFRYSDDAVLTKAVLSTSRQSPVMLTNELVINGSRVEAMESSTINLIELHSN